jgi:hypothetical protein
MHAYCVAGGGLAGDVIGPRAGFVLIGALAMLRATPRRAVHKQGKPAAVRPVVRIAKRGPARVAVAVLTVVLRAWPIGESPETAAGRPGLPDPRHRRVSFTSVLGRWHRVAGAR